MSIQPPLWRRQTFLNVRLRASLRAQPLEPAHCESHAVRTGGPLWTWTGPTATASVIFWEFSCSTEKIVVCNICVFLPTTFWNTAIRRLDAWSCTVALHLRSIRTLCCACSKLGEAPAFGLRPPNPCPTWDSDYFGIHKNKSAPKTRETRSCALTFRELLLS